MLHQIQCPDKLWIQIKVFRVCHIVNALYSGKIGFEQYLHHSLCYSLGTRMKKNLPIQAGYITPRFSLKEGSNAYRSLREEITKNGILEPQYGYYAVLFITTTLGFFGSLYLIYNSTSLVWTTIWTIIFAFFTVQFAGLSHDAGHRSIFRSVRWNNLTGHIISSLMANGFEQWRLKHNLHHAHTNDDEDPDIHLPVISFTQKIAASKHGFARILVRYQYAIYYFLGTLVIFSTRMNNVSFMRRKGFQRYYLWHIPVYVIGLMFWFIGPFVFFGPIRGLIFFIVFSLTAGTYMFQVFAPNHKGMPYVKEGTKFSFLEQQIRTSRNLSSNPLTDYVYLGLNYQIEHHLFPSCPRNRLKDVRPYVKDLCRKLRIPYEEVGIVETNAIILKELYAVAHTLKK